MCGIVGAIATRDVAPILLEGLKRLEYRGYDSAGLAVLSPTGELQLRRRVGKVAVLKASIESEPMLGKIGISHTRWATHGEPAERNAHPHRSDFIVVVHNGIIENYEPLKIDLIAKGYQFNSETDTEVIAHLIHSLIQEKQCTLLQAVQQAVTQLRGAYGALVMDSRDPDRLIAARSGSPMVIGLGEGEHFIASDPLALLPVTSQFIYLDEGDIADIERHQITLMNAQGERVQRPVVQPHINYDAGDKGEYTHYMQKEIYEQPLAIKNTLAGRIHQQRVDLSELGETQLALLQTIEHIQIVACGTAYNAGAVARYWFESLAGMPCDVEIASEYRYRTSAPRKNSLVIALSQSGETADTLAAIRLAKENGCLATMAICNVASSTLVRETDLALLTKAGTEVGVASTKAFTTQLTVLLLLAGLFSRRYSTTIEQDIVHALQLLPNRIDTLLDGDLPIEHLAKQFEKRIHALFLGRGDEYPIAMEAALKLKEISYIHAEAYAAGELKHGPLALIDTEMPVIVIAPDNALLEKLKANVEEVRSRGGILYIITDTVDQFIESDTVHVVTLPKIEAITAPIYFTIPMQLLSYYVALVKGTDVDQPRNLAKSVTVE